MSEALEGLDLHSLRPCPRNGESWRTELGEG
jgi:hypothetical protein